MKTMLLGMAIILFGIAWLVMFSNDGRNDVGFNIALLGLAVSGVGFFKKDTNKHFLSRRL